MGDETVEHDKETSEVADTKPEAVPAIVDSTLREGQQHGLVLFTTKTAMEIAACLDSFGVDIIEVGHPGISPADAEACSAVAELGLRADTLSHARPSLKDVETAAGTGTDWVGIFAGVNSLAAKHKFHRATGAILDAVAEAVTCARQMGRRVRYTCEDASRTSLADVRTAFELAVDSGAERLSFADTTGTMTPRAMYSTIKKLTDCFGPQIHVHCHNDFGMATANTLAAFEAGAIALDVSVDGIGERCGIAPLAEVVFALKYLYGVDGPWHMSEVSQMSSMLRCQLRPDAIDTRPLIGRFAFAHKAGLHVAAEIECSTAYETVPPACLGQERVLLLSKLMGLSGLAKIAETAGVEMTDEALELILKRLKASSRVHEVHLGTQETDG